MGVLREVNVPLKSREECGQVFKESEFGHPNDEESRLEALRASYRIKKFFICAENTDHRDTCQGDSGGPLASKDLMEGFNLLGLPVGAMDADFKVVIIPECPSLLIG